MEFVRSALRSILKGQALVETAIIAPILIFILIGVFEVGWALRGYLVLVNASRETARFAARPKYLDYTKESYNNIVKHGLDSINQQIPFTESGTIIISIIRVDPQWVCNPYKVKPDFSMDCDCKEAATNPYSPTLLISPLTEATATFKYPYTSTHVSWKNFIEEVTEKKYHVIYSDTETLHLNLIEFNRYIACTAMLDGNKPLVDNQVIVEMFYQQPQLFGFPVISNPLTDPIPMYAHSTFRIIEAYR